MKESKKLHIATSRPIGEKCKEWALQKGYTLTSMADCDIFISVLFDTILLEEYIKTKPCYNFHPGILPWYRGAGAYSWVLINNEKETGVTLHKIDKDIDHGDIISIQKFPIKKEDTAETLFRKAEDIIFEMFTLSLPIIIKGNVITRAGDEGLIYYRKELETARDLTKYIKAFTFSGKPNAFFINKKGEKIELKYE